MSITIKVKNTILSYKNFGWVKMLKAGDEGAVNGMYYQGVYPDVTPTTSQAADAYCSPLLEVSEGNKIYIKDFKLMNVSFSCYKTDNTYTKYRYSDISASLVDGEDEHSKYWVVPSGIARVSINYADSATNIIGDGTLTPYYAVKS